jgi:hypothetical protein
MTSSVFISNTFMVSFPSTSISEKSNFQGGSIIKLEHVIWFDDVTSVNSTQWWWCHHYIYPMLSCTYPPAPVYQKQPNGEDNFQTGSESKVESVIWFDDVKSIYF